MNNTVSYLYFSLNIIINNNFKIEMSYNIYTQINIHTNNCKTWNLLYTLKITNYKISTQYSYNIGPVSISHTFCNFNFKNGHKKKKPNQTLPNLVFYIYLKA